MKRFTGYQRIYTRDGMWPTDVNAERLPRLLQPLLSVVARRLRWNYFWYRTTDGRRHLWFGSDEQGLPE